VRLLVPALVQVLVPVWVLAPVGVLVPVRLLVAWCARAWSQSIRQLLR